jgi:hypothetical protein
MNAEQLAGALAWVAVTVGYAWTVRALGRMAHAPGAPDEEGTTIVVPVEGRRVGAARSRGGTSDASGAARSAAS